MTDVTQDQGELVTCVACDGVWRSHARAQALGNAKQYLVAHGVAEGVVDLLETVEIEEHHRETLAGPARFLDR